MVGVNATATAAQSGGLPDSTLVGVLVSFLSASLVYVFRQYWEKRKLKRALVTEVSQMEGLKECADQMDRIDEPPERPLQPDDVPAVGSIPTSVYEGSTVKIGLLGGLVGQGELNGVVNFYSRVQRHKGIVEKVSSDEDVADTDQEDLYDDIRGLNEKRNRIVKHDTFDLD